MNNELDKPSNELDDDLIGTEDEWPQEGQIDAVDEDPPDDEDELDIVDDKGPNRSAVMFLVVCGCTALAIYLLGLRHKPREASAEQQAIEAKVDVALAKLLAHRDSLKAVSASDSTTDQIVQAFQEYPGKKQLMFDQLHRNPFSDSAWQGIDDWLEDDAEQVDYAQTLSRSLAKKVEGLRLQSVLYMPPHSSCRINDEVLGEGQSVDGTFVIKTIGADRVTLAADGTEFVLQLPW